MIMAIGLTLIFAGFATIRFLGGMYFLNRADYAGVGLLLLGVSMCLVSTCIFLWRVMP